MRNANWASRVLLAMLTACSSTSIAQPSLHKIHQELHTLANALEWKNSTHATYAPVYDAARPARESLCTSHTHRDGRIPQAADFCLTLKRLVVESGYLTKLSNADNYTQSVLDSTMFLTGSVDEWRYTINAMSKNLEHSSTFKLPKPTHKAAKNVSARTPAGTVFCDFDTAPHMVVVPAGSYTAGSNAAEQDYWQVPEARRDFELPQRRVHIPKPLAFSQTEVTRREFERFVQQTNYEIRGGARWWNPQNNSAMVFNPQLSYRDPGFPQTDDHPVVAITRLDALAYAKWLSTVSGATYRLPSENEWEWAARAGSQDSFFWGNSLDIANKFANTYDVTSEEANHFYWPRNNVTDGYAYTAPVASFEPNAFGLYDVTGNAREFMADDWVEHLTDRDNDASVHRGPAPFPVVRGGAWNYAPQNLRINYRSAYFSSEVSNNMFGIRLVREL